MTAVVVTVLVIPVMIGAYLFESRATAATPSSGQDVPAAPSLPTGIPFREVPVEEIERQPLGTQIADAIRTDVQFLETLGYIPTPEDAMPPSDEEVARHIVPVNSILPRLTFVPTIPKPAGFQLLGALEVPTVSLPDPTDPGVMFPAERERLSTVQLVYRVRQVNASHLLIVSETSLMEEGLEEVRMPSLAVNDRIGGHRAVRRSLRGQKSGREFVEISWFDGRLLYTVSGYTNIGDVRNLAQGHAVAAIQ
ncbi:MAG: hypothetical protein M3O70_29270 [Actinomycetota bacterium]|nr:hypothetical protein [Actinomycetota bacterium]